MSERKSNSRGISIPGFRRRENNIVHNLVMAGGGIALLATLLGIIFWGLGHI